MLVDARPEIGVPLRCGEFTALRIFRILKVPPRPGWIRKRMGKSKAKSFVVLNREIFENELAALLAQHGVVVESGTRVVDVGPFDGERRRVRMATDKGEKTLLDETAYTQPAMFAIEYALAQLWRGWGVEPGVVLGHSVGECAAACVAGVFGLEDGLKLIAARG